MKVFFITSRFPFPIEKGDKLRAYNQIKVLSKYFKVYLYAGTISSISSDDILEMEKYCEAITTFKCRGIKGVMSPSNLLKTLPLQVGYFYSGSISKKLKQDYQRIKPDHIHHHLIRTGEYLKNIQANSSIDFMDAFSKSLRGLSAKVSWLQRPIYLLEAKLVRQYEQRLLRRFKKKFAISNRDADYIDTKKIYNIETLKNGIDVEYFQPIDIKKKYDIAFVGNLGYEPNIQAVKYINLLAKRLPKLKFLIAGARSERIEKKSLATNVIIKGWYDDIREAYCSAQIFVAPIFYGTGMQNKILESMSLGIPCITTDSVNETIRGTHMENIIIASTELEFEQAITELFNDMNMRDKIGELGRRYVINNFSWEQQTRPLIDYIEQQKDHNK